MCPELVEYSLYFGTLQPAIKNGKVCFSKIPVLEELPKKQDEQEKRGKFITELRSLIIKFNQVEKSYLEDLSSIQNLQDLSKIMQQLSGLVPEIGQALSELSYYSQDARTTLMSALELIRDRTDDEHKTSVLQLLAMLNTRNVSDTSQQISRPAEREKCTCYNPCPVHRRHNTW